MRDKPWRSRYAAERASDEAFLRARKHQRVVYNARARLDVVDAVPGEGSPRSHSQGKTRSCPVVYTDGAIAEVRNRALQSRSDRRVFERCRMNQDCSVERAP